MTKSRGWRGLCGLLLLTLLAVPAAAQETTATITGVVTDQSGAVVPGATVLIKRIDTGRTNEATTNQDGRYTVSLLDPGRYEVTFTISGFKPSTVTGIELHVNDRLTVDGKVGVGGVTETVEVHASSQFVQPSPAVQTLMGPTQVQELPLNNRNFVGLATLVPGVSSDLGDEVGIGLTSTVSVSINGGRRNAVNWLLDGVSNVDVGSNITLLSTPTLESIQEFKIITSSYAAEWPRSGGGVINVVTKSGTSKFSGSAYEFFRHDNLNANSFFRNRNIDQNVSGRAPRLRYNNFGATLGGPLLPSREKAFFFYSQEWRRISRAPAGTFATTVNPAWLTDPTNLNYVAPENRDPIAVKLLALWPAPNDFSSTGVARFLNTNLTVNDTRQEVVRLDYDFRPNWKLVGRYTHDLSQTIEPGGLFTGTLVPNVSITHTDVPGQVAAMELRTSMGRALNELKIQFSTNRIRTSDDDRNQNLRSQFGLNIPELFPENEAGRNPTFVVTGLSSANTIQRFDIEYFNYTYGDTFTLQRGDHTYKAGAMVALESKNENANNNTQGSFTFGTTTGVRTGFQNFLTGNRDGLCGTACSYSEAEIDVTNNLRFNRYEAFVQDTWRFARHTTLDLGIRYSLYPAIIDKNNILSTFDPSRYDPAKAPTCSSATCGAMLIGTGDLTNGLIIAGQNSPFGDAIYKTDKNNFQPRVGLSWDMFGDGVTIGRAGYGIYYDQPLVGIFEQNAFTNPPYVNNVTVQNPSLANPVAGVLPGTTGVRNLIATSVPFETPRTQQWNIGFQRRLYDRGGIDIGYVGSKGKNLIQPVDINQPQPADVVAVGIANVNTVRPYRQYGVINMRQTTARTDYHGLLTQFRHEGGRAGTYTLNYTLSRARGTATNDRDAVDLPQNPLDLEAEYADLRTDRRHMFSATYILELPFFREADNALLRNALGGWQVSGITRIESGPPISRIVTSSDSSRRGIRANQIGDPQVGELPFPFWFNPAAFQPPALGTYGSTGRAPFRLPGRNQTDFSLSKNFYGWGKRIQFRADAINAFNHTQWLAVDNACSAAATITQNRCDIGGADTFGQITSTRLPREIQASLKLYW
jgi:hypothetical protein